MLTILLNYRNIGLEGINIYINVKVKIIYRQKYQFKINIDIKI